MDYENFHRFRLFVDMDGTLAKFIPQLEMSVLYQKGYFRNLPPQQNVIDAVKILLWAYHDVIEVFVLTAYLDDSRFAYSEKMEWLKEHLPIDEEHIIMVPNGQNKREYINNFDPAKDVLLDDYTPNLSKWAPGRAIKILNGINNTHGTWEGPRISMQRDPLDMARAVMEQIRTESMCIRDEFHEPFKLPKKEVFNQGMIAAGY